MEDAKRVRIRRYGNWMVTTHVSGLRQMWEAEDRLHFSQLFELDQQIEQRQEELAKLPKLSGEAFALQSYLRADQQRMRQLQRTRSAMVRAIVELQPAVNKSEDMAQRWQGRWSQQFGCWAAQLLVCLSADLGEVVRLVQFVTVGSRSLQLCLTLAKDEIADEAIVDSLSRGLNMSLELIELAATPMVVSQVI